MMKASLYQAEMYMKKLILLINAIFIVTAFLTVSHAENDDGNQAVKIDMQRQKTLRLTGASFDELDTDNDGRISLQEAYTNNYLHKNFEAFDVDSDSFINISEYHSYERSVYDKSE